MEAADSRKAVSWGGGIAAVLGLGALAGSIVFGVNTRWDELAKAFLAGAAVMTVAGTALAITPRAVTYYKSRYGKPEISLAPNCIDRTNGTTDTIQLRARGRSFNSSKFEVTIGDKTTILRGNKLDQQDKALLAAAHQQYGNKH